ncbi:MAG: hypothetical protein ACRDPF_24320 [Streptosporangiaceae bacterium]
MAAKLRQVFAFSGVVNRPPGEKPDPALLEYAVSLAAVAMVDGARAWRVEPSPPGGYHVEAITPRRL